MKIICIGEILVDMIGQTNAGLKQNIEFAKRPGGAPANVAVAASRLGADVEMVATTGDDTFGIFLTEKLESEGIETSNLKQLEDEDTTLAFAALDKDAKPEFSFNRGADRFIHREQLDLTCDEETIVHIGSLPFTNPETALNLLSFLKSTDAIVSFDPNIRQDLMSQNYGEMLEQVLEHVDILTAADEEIEFFGGLETLREKMDEIIVTRGAEGAEIFTEEERYFAKSRDIDVVDTTGAGDALTGAYLAFRDQGRKQALEKAVESASVSITSKGAMSALPELSDLE